MLGADKEAQNVVFRKRRRCAMRAPANWVSRLSPHPAAKRGSRPRPQKRNGTRRGPLSLTGRNMRRRTLIPRAGRPDAVSLTFERLRRVGRLNSVDSTRSTQRLGRTASGRSIAFEMRSNDPPSRQHSTLSERWALGGRGSGAFVERLACVRRGVTRAVRRVGRQSVNWLSAGRESGAIPRRLPAGPAGEAALGQEKHARRGCPLSGEDGARGGARGAGLRDVALVPSARFIP